MNMKTLLKGMDCTCGRHHSCDIGYIAIERDAIAHLSELCSKEKTVLIVADRNTFRAAGEQTMEALKGKTVKTVIFPGEKVLIPDESAVADVLEHCGTVDKIVGVGSGVIQDLCKYVSFQTGIPYCIVATAPSMDGYASTGAAMIMGGMKVTYPCHVPSAILADPAILKDAPLEMIQAGYGDIIGKYSALNDWRLSHTVNGEYFCEAIYQLTFEMVKKTLSLGDKLLERDEDSVKTLMEALVGVGVAMSYAGSSRPASGSEHHLSHYFEITGIVRGEPYFPHGIDVAFSTIVTAQLREEILAKQFPNKQYRISREVYLVKMREIYGPVADGCVALQDKLGRYDRDLLQTYKEKESEIRSILADMPKQWEIEMLVKQIGLDKNDFYKRYGEKKINEAISYAKDLKDRYTVLWMYYDLFGEKSGK